MSRLFVDFFVSQCRKNFEGEPFSAVFRKLSGSEVNCGWEGGGGEGYQNYLPKTFFLTLPKSFVGKPSRVSLISGIEKIYA